jgi:hypothetical protein
VISSRNAKLLAVLEAGLLFFGSDETPMTAARLSTCCCYVL